MARIGTMQMPISHVIRNATFHFQVTGLRVFRWRMWLTAKIVRCGAWVSGMRCTVKVSSDDG